MRTLRRSAAWLPLAVLAACGGSSSEPVIVRTPAAELSVSVAPRTLRVGENQLAIELRDRDGKPIEGAALSARVHMHAMGAMPPMGGPAAVSEEGSGHYRAEFELEMGGTWNVEIQAALPGGATARAEGSVTVGTPGLRLEGLGAAGAEPDPAQPAAAAAEGHPAEFQLDPRRLQRVGVRTTTAEHKALSRQVRAVGRVVADETTLQDVSLKVRGWVGTVEIDAVGDPVERGQVLFSAYSPELYAAQEEYVQALRSQARARASEAPERADYLVRAARKRLRLWDIGDADLDGIAARGEALKHLPIRSPVSGYVMEKNVVEGSAFEAGEKLYRIAPLGRIWVEADVYEFELPWVRAGQRASVELPYLANQTLEAQVAYVYPTLNPTTRTARVRLELPNPALALRPDMYATVRLHVERGEGLVVPLSAILHTGRRSFVFLALGEGRFRPQEVEVGMQSGEEAQILHGLEPGDRIVSSGTFLVASESRLRAALEQW